MMRIRLTTSLAGHGFSHARGDVIDYDDRQSRRLIAAGFAEPLEPFLEASPAVRLAPPESPPEVPPQVPPTLNTEPETAVLDEPAERADEPIAPRETADVSGGDEPAEPDQPKGATRRSKSKKRS